MSRNIQEVNPDTLDFANMRDYRIIFAIPCQDVLFIAIKYLTYFNFCSNNKSMKIEFDPAKRDMTLKYRGLDMACADEVFANSNLTFPDIRFDYGEMRFITIGYLGKRMVVLVWTQRKNTVRIISMRKANEREQKKYGPRMG